MYDLLGREIALLADEQKASGGRTVRFDGSALVSGVYFYRLASEEGIRTRPMTLLT